MSDASVLDPCCGSRMFWLPHTVVEKLRRALGES